MYCQEIANNANPSVNWPSSCTSLEEMESNCRSAYFHGDEGNMLSINSLIDVYSFVHDVDLGTICGLVFIYIMFTYFVRPHNILQCLL